MSEPNPLVELSERLSEFRETGHLSLDDPKLREIASWVLSRSHTVIEYLCGRAGDWVVECTGPLDHFFPSTVSIGEWVERVSGAEDVTRSHCKRLSRGEAWDEFLSAAAEVSRHENFCDMRDEPRVAYDPKSDSHAFIFKVNDDGLTYIVSRPPLEYGPDAGRQQ